jgi:hypothetical protein
MSSIQLVFFFIKKILGDCHLLLQILATDCGHKIREPLLGIKNPSDPFFQPKISKKLYEP